MPGTLARGHEHPLDAQPGSALTPEKGKHTDKQIIRYVVDQTTAWRRKRYQDDDRFSHFSLTQ